MPHRRRKAEELPDWKHAHNTSHKEVRVRARVEHVVARMTNWKILRDCCLKGDGVHHAMLGITRLRPRRVGERPDCSLLTFPPARGHLQDSP